MVFGVRYKVTKDRRDFCVDRLDGDVDVGEWDRMRSEVQKYLTGPGLEKGSGDLLRVLLPEN